MGAKAISGTEHLGKNHSAECPKRGTKSLACDCGWRVQYKGEVVTLSKWTGKTINPREKSAAKLARNRVIKAIDDGTFDPRGEQESVKSDDRSLQFFIADVWTEKHGNIAGFEGAPLKSMAPGGSYTAMINMITTSKSGGFILGNLTLAELVEDPDRIQKWLNAMKAAESWSAVNYNRYYEFLFGLFTKATKWHKNGKPYMLRNPLLSEDVVKLKTKKYKKERPGRLAKGVEQRLFDVVLQLNLAPQIENGRKRAKLTQVQADQIRTLVERGKKALAAWWKAGADEAKKPTGVYQSEIAKQFGVTGSVVSDIMAGRIWNPALQPKTTTTGTEMERRLVAAFDGGLRAGEMLRIQLCHVNFTPITIKGRDGRTITAYEITLPPDITKGGATTGETEYIYAVTPRFRKMLDLRRFTLKRNPQGYVFGDEAGNLVTDFDDSWHRLFDLAGVVRGRKRGTVWHTIRHEFCNKIAELTSNPVDAQKLMRHKDLETTRLYFAEPERDTKLEALAKLA